MSEEKKILFHVKRYIYNQFYCLITKSININRPYILDCKDCDFHLHCILFRCTY